MTSHTSSHFESSPLRLGMAFHNLVHNLALPPEAPTAPPERRCGRFVAFEVPTRFPRGFHIWREARPPSRGPHGAPPRPALRFWGGP